MATTPQFKRLIKRAKELQIETVDELTDIICSNEFSDEQNPITGADFEIAKKQLKLKQKIIRKKIRKHFFSKEKPRTFVISKLNYKP